jgi:hypothetical protein
MGAEDGRSLIRSRVMLAVLKPSLLADGDKSTEAAT